MKEALIVKRASELSARTIKETAEDEKVRIQEQHRLEFASSDKLGTVKQQAARNAKFEKEITWAENLVINRERENNVRVATYAGQDVKIANDLAARIATRAEEDRKRIEKRQREDRARETNSHTRRRHTT